MFTALGACGAGTIYAAGTHVASQRDSGSSTNEFIIFYKDLDVFLSAKVPPKFQQVQVGSLQGVLTFVEDKRGVAATTSDGRTWSPLGIVRPAHFGVYPNVETDQTVNITRLIYWSAMNEREVLWASGKYVFSDVAVVEDTVFVDWKCDGPVELYSNKVAPVRKWADDYFIKFGAKTIRHDHSITSIFQGDARIALGSTQDIDEHALLVCKSTHMIETDHRGQARHGFTMPARVVNDTVVELDRAAPCTALVGNVSGEVQSVISTSELVVAGLENLSRSEARYKINFETIGGVPSDKDAYVVDFDVDRQSILCHESNGTFPKGLVSGDRFTLVRELVVYISHAAHVSIVGDFTFSRAFHDDAKPLDLGFRGLQIDRGLRPYLRGLTFRNFSEAGLKLDFCYEARVSNIECIGSNRAYRSYYGTGYGVSNCQSSFSTFENIIGFNCRRTLDFGGTQGASYFCRAENVRGFGGGTAYDGTRFWPEGKAWQSVVGSHGGAFFTEYTNCVGIDVKGVLNLRGDDEVAKDIRGFGKIRHMVNTFISGSCQIDGIYYSNRNNEIGYKEKYRKFSDSDAGLTDVIRISCDRRVQGKPITVRNVDCFGVKRSLFSCKYNGNVGPLIYGDIAIVVDDEGNTGDEFWLIRNTGKGTPVLNMATICNGNVSVINNRAYPKRVIRDIDLSSFKVISGVAHKLPGGRVMVQLADDTAIGLDVWQRPTTPLVLWLDSKDKGSLLFNSFVVAGMGDDRANGNSAHGVNILSVDLVGTTGDDDAVNIAYFPPGSPKLFIENRYGSKKVIMIDCPALTL